MGIECEIHGRMRAPQIAPVHRAALVVLTALLSIAAVGCGTQSSDRKSADTESRDDSKATASAGAKRGAKANQALPASHDAMPTGRTNRIRLTPKGCVEFEPHWTNIRVGQSLTWHSDVKSPVTIHVSPGAFDRVKYVVRPGATVSTGAALSPGSYLIWTEPTACQGVSRGVQGSGPGVTVEDVAPR